MTSGQLAYLLLAIAAFGFFGLALAWATWKSGHK